ncbi:hypothetical protein P691DRAFT_701121 [Macrolepiota fuliginosa MF-IS2]|uniref:Uncharacterized protein n=1 Tax=Macrolepiota fuliginosa MF-IS2 TaxID=1400762 RepID=A0A9P6C3B8_9AGAR|nr:hypothetical protein P691DRAFT_701121 [Macrolepiota fuliginosa MF-IS2]
MQNALRRQQLQEVELERAEVKDEGKWEVGQDVKEAWGIGQGTQKSDTAVYEMSYLPFLFSSEHEDAASPVSKPSGRRMFDKNGRDVSRSQSQSKTQTNGEDGIDEVDEAGLAAGTNGDVTSKLDESPNKGRRLRVHAKPRSISSAPGKNLKGFNTFDQPSTDTLGSLSGTKGKSAREAVFESLKGVGTDLRSASNVMNKKEAGEIDDTIVNERSNQKQQQQQPRTVSISTGFLKPAGVDAPSSRTPHGIIDGAREKRQRDPNDASGEGKKKSKKKRSGMSNV